MNHVTTGDERAFRQLFQLFSSTVYSFSLKLTRSPVQAEEIVQEVFLKLWIHRERLQRIDNFSAYLFTATKHHAFNVLKHRAIEERAKKILHKEQVDSHCDTEDTVVLRDYQQFLDQAISDLPPQQRLVYRLCHLEGLRYEEVARKLNISSLTVKTHMHQALRTIKSQFADIVRVGILLLPIVAS